MGKKSRRAGRRNRPRRPKLAARSTVDGLRLVVATSPEAISDGRFLEHDLRMIRSALLYADTVELVSPVANMLGGAAALHEGGPDAWIELLASLDDDTLHLVVADRDPAEFRSLLKTWQELSQMPRAQRRRVLGPHDSILRTLEEGFRQTVDGTKGPLRDFLERAGVPELEEALQEGALEVNWDAVGIGDSDRMIEQYSSYLTKALESSDTHLLLDEGLAGLARAMITDGHVEPAQLTLSRATRSQVGTGLITHLPAFPGATMSTVLETRAELAGPLAAYRSGVREVTQKVRSEPFDPSMRGEVTDLWRDVVRPTVDTLRADLSHTRLAHDAALNLGIDVKTLVTGGGIYFGVETLTSISDFAAAGIAAAPVVGKAVTSAIKESAGRRESARQHEFFYLMRLDDSL